VIDEDFQPDRRQLGALGILLVAHQNAPLKPALREDDLYERMAGRYIGSAREPWIEELVRHRLITLVDTGFRTGDRIGGSTTDVCLTPAGIFYYISRAAEVGMQARTPTDDFPDEIVDAPWVIQSYFSPSDGEWAPGSDSFVRFDDNEENFADALAQLDDVYEALKSDNEIGANNPLARDRVLEELSSIRTLLEKREGWVSQVRAVSFLTFCYITSQFADRPVGYLAEQAWDAIQIVLGMR
jgi:hypothetical protein